MHAMVYAQNGANIFWSIIPISDILEFLKEQLIFSHLCSGEKLN